MSRVVVVGGGLGGLASAARLAKLGHQVSLVEARDELGGAVGLLRRDGFTWDTGPTSTLLPAVLRDLFRKTGRPLEAELDLVPVEPVARHVFRAQQGRRRRGQAESVTSRVELDLPAGSRADQTAAVDAALGDGLGAEWTSYLDDFAEVWEHLRRDWLEQPWSKEHASRETRKLLGLRTSLLAHTTKELGDERLRVLARHRLAFDGHDPRDVPAWMGVLSHVERTFGSWTVTGGMGRVAEVLADRLETRGVEVVRGATVRDLVLREGRAVGVRSDAGEHDADVVVVAIDPRRLPALASYVVRTMPTIPPTVCHLGLSGEVPDLPAQVVVHGLGTLVLDTGRHLDQPGGLHAWTIQGRGRITGDEENGENEEDMVLALARGGIDVRRQVEVRVDRRPRELVQEWNGSPLGVLWQGRATLEHRLGTRTPLAGVLMAGAHTTPGAGIPFVGLGAALVAQVVGPA